MKTILTLRHKVIHQNTLAAFVLSASLCTNLVACSSKEHSSENPNEQASSAHTSSAEALYTNSMTANEDITKSRQNAITRAASLCSPAVVGINVIEVQEYISDPFGNDLFEFFMQDFGGIYRRKMQQEVRGLGSGFLISPDGYILTNDHVAGRAKKIVVTLTGGQKYDAKIVGTDKTSDVALLKIDGKNLPYLKLGNSDDVIVGEWAIALGNPFGLFDNNAKPTVTVGVISNTNVNMTQEQRVYKGMIQTDAAISSGNSGGALVNSLGEVIGMNTIIYSTAQNSRGSGSIGIGFAVPINRIKKIVDVLRTNGKVDREFSTGMSIRQVDEQLARYLRLSKAEGVVITEIIRNSSAERAGFEPGDIIIEIDGNKIERDDDVLIAINDGVVGQKLSIKIRRDDEVMQKILVLDRRSSVRR